MAETKLAMSCSCSCSFLLFFQCLCLRHITPTRKGAYANVPVACSVPCSYRLSHSYKPHITCNLRLRLHTLAIHNLVRSHNTSPYEAHPSNPPPHPEGQSAAMSDGEELAQPPAEAPFFDELIRGHAAIAEPEPETVPPQRHLAGLFSPPAYASFDAYAPDTALAAFDPPMHATTPLVMQHLAPVPNLPSAHMSPHTPYEPAMPYLAQASPHLQQMHPMHQQHLHAVHPMQAVNNASVSHRSQQQQAHPSLNTHHRMQPAPGQLPHAHVHPHATTAIEPPRRRVYRTRGAQAAAMQPPVRPGHPGHPTQSPHPTPPEPLAPPARTGRVTRAATRVPQNGRGRATRGRGRGRGHRKATPVAPPLSRAAHSMSQGYAVGAARQDEDATMVTTGSYETRPPYHLLQGDAHSDLPPPCYGAVAPGYSPAYASVPPAYGALPPLASDADAAYGSSYSTQEGDYWKQTTSAAGLREEQETIRELREAFAANAHKTDAQLRADQEQEETELELRAAFAANAHKSDEQFRADQEQEEKEYQLRLAQEEKEYELRLAIEEERKNSGNVGTAVTTARTRRSPTHSRRSPTRTRAQALAQAQVPIPGQARMMNVAPHDVTGDLRQCTEVNLDDFDSYGASRMIGFSKEGVPHPGTVFCAHCTAFFGNGKSLDRHVKQMHSRLAKVLCPICAQPCKSKTNQERHIKSCHGGEASAQRKCPECTITFSSMRCLSAHVRDRHPQKHKLRRGKALRKQVMCFTCRICGDMHKERNNLTRHVKTTHLKLYDFSCHLCSALFSTQNNVDVHIDSCATSRGLALQERI